MAFIQNIALVSLIVFLLSGTVDAQKFVAQEVVNEMANKFRGAHTYQTSGVLTTIKNFEPYKKLTWSQALTHSELLTAHSLSFSFYFERPSKLRFDWLNVNLKVNRKSVIWTDGEKHFSWLPSSGESDGRFVWGKGSSLKMLLQDADFNQSSSMASILFAQLTGDERAFTFNEMKDAEVVREEVIDGRTCLVILGTISKDPWALWIDKSTFVLRKMRLLISLTSFDEVVETGKQKLTIGEVRMVDPSINEPVSSRIFEYKPNVKKKDINLAKY